MHFSFAVECLTAVFSAGACWSDDFPSFLSARWPPSCRPDDCRVHLSVWCHDLSAGIYIQEALCIGVWSSPCYSSFCRCFLNGGICAYRRLLCLGSVLLFMLADLVSCRFILLGFNTVSSHPPRRSDRDLELLRWTLLNPGAKGTVYLHTRVKRMLHVTYSALSKVK